MKNRTFACELEPGDRIAAGQTFQMHSLGSFSPDEVTLVRDYIVMREPTAHPTCGDPGTEWVEVVVRQRQGDRSLICLAAPRGRVVRTA